MRVFVEGIGLRAPGLDGWAAGRAVLAGEASYEAAPTNLAVGDLLPPNERRRAGVPIKLALAVGQEAFTQAGRPLAETATVFASSSGDNDNVHAILEVLASAPREVSPTRFHNSVHNAVSGYWGIAAQAHTSSSSLCGFDSSFAVGLLDAAVQVATSGQAVALMAYDHPYGEPLNTLRHVEGNVGVGLVLAPEQGVHAIAALDIEFRPGAAVVDTMADGALERLRQYNPAARSLPLLAALARGTNSSITLDYQGDCHLALTVDMPGAAA